MFPVGFHSTSVSIRGGEGTNRRSRPGRETLSKVVGELIRILYFVQMYNSTRLELMTEAPGVYYPPRYLHYPSR